MRKKVLKFIMLSFIICEENSEMRTVYSGLIKRFLYTNFDHYKIYEYSRFTLAAEEEISHIEGARIYILNIDTSGPSVIDMARKIREDGDYISPIILLTHRDRASLIDELKHILYLDILPIDGSISMGLLKSLREAYKIVTRHAVYTFTAFDELYRIPYDDINYIVKNSYDDTVTIYTKDDSYLNYITINKIEALLASDNRFFKSHRSCILNLYNVTSYDKKSNTIIFKNGTTTNIISRHKKAELTRRLKGFDDDYISGK